MRLIGRIVVVCACVGALSGCGDGSNLGSCVVHSGFDAVVMSNLTETECEQQCELPDQACTWTPDPSRYPRIGFSDWRMGGRHAALGAFGWANDSKLNNSRPWASGQVALA
jgi:hypothetical protein